MAEPLLETLVTVSVYAQPDMKEITVKSSNLAQLVLTVNTVKMEEPQLDSLALVDVYAHKDLQEHTVKHMLFVQLDPMVSPV